MPANAEATIKIYRSGDAHAPAGVCRRGETADAEPVIPGW
jgi:hypothetical protein